MWVIENSIAKFIEVINFLIIARVLFSWISRDISNPIFRILYQLTEPILAPFRSLLSRLGVGGMIDFSPILAILALDVIGNIIINLL
jgi:YggT family protein